MLAVLHWTRFDSFLHYVLGELVSLPGASPLPFQNDISLLVTFNDFAGWATYLYAGETEWTNDFSFFSVIIDLTDAGHG